jgi:hypothetical protein
MYTHMHYSWPYAGNLRPSLEQKAMGLIGRAVGISLNSGQGVSGVVCGVNSGQIFMMQYLYNTQFATFHYSFNEIQDIHAFPSC